MVRNRLSLDNKAISIAHANSTLVIKVSAIINSRGEITSATFFCFLTFCYNSYFVE